MPLGFRNCGHLGLGHVLEASSDLLLFLIMPLSAAHLDRFLHAIADPTRRRILEALKEKGGNSLGKDIGLCAFDIEQRVKLAQPTNLPVNCFAGCSRMNSKLRSCFCPKVKPRLHLF